MLTPILAFSLFMHIPHLIINIMFLRSHNPFVLLGWIVHVFIVIVVLLQNVMNIVLHFISCIILTIRVTINLSFQLWKINFQARLSTS